MPRSLAVVGMIDAELQPDQIDQKLTPKINHAAPGIFNVACRRLFKDAFMNVVRDLVAQILFHFASDLAERWESVGRGRTFWPKLFFLRKPESTNARENFQPWEKKPTHCDRETPDPAAANKINRKKSGSENAERARFLCIGI